MTDLENSENPAQPAPTPTPNEAEQTIASAEAEQPIESAVDDQDTSTNKAQQASESAEAVEAEQVSQSAETEQSTANSETQDAQVGDDTAPIQSKIGFPAGMMSERPLRLDVLAARKGVYAVLNKPADMLIDSYLGAPKEKSAMLALREQKGKGELERLGMEAPYAVNQLDYEMSGAALIAMNKTSADALRNAMWSGFFRFEYLLLCKTARKLDEEISVALPVLMHEERPIWLVSHRFGKKARTDFKLIKTSGDYQLWSAKSATVRPHQIRLHAAEAGLLVAGERIYSKTPHVFLSKLKEEYVLSRELDEERPLYPSLAIHLAKISFDGKDAGMSDLGKISATAPLPKKFAVCIKKLGFGEIDF